MTEQTWQIGDCTDIMREMDGDSVDLIVTDPPYGYSFMGKDWDKAVPSVDIWQACLRVLKPGAFVFIMSAPRQDVLAHNLVNLSDAGFDTGFTSIYWTFASGFPKAGNVSKMVDKRLGAEREVIGKSPHHCNGRVQNRDRNSLGWSTMSDAPDIRNITAPATPEANALDGSYGGFQPKPAVEVIIVVMKPLSEKTYVDQALANRKGVTWLDDVRIPYWSDGDRPSECTYQDIRNTCVKVEGENRWTSSSGKKRKTLEYRMYISNTNGRFPANLLVSDDMLNDGTTTKGSDAIRHNNQHLTSGKGIYGKYNQKDTTGYADSGSFSRYFDLDAWWNERIAHLPKEAQKTFPFMIVPKASKSEKGANNKHPTVKPVKLFSWLMTLGSREGDLVLDPFLGSGVALAAGRLTNRSVIGCEIDPQWEHLYADRCMKHTPGLDTYW